MRKGIERLAWDLSFEEGSATLGELSEKYGETTERLMDALDVLKLLQGLHTQIPSVDWSLSPVDVIFVS